eukprot:7070760-Pyramimonas_sp.AAC.1
MIRTGGLFPARNSTCILAVLCQPPAPQVRGVPEVGGGARHAHSTEGSLGPFLTEQSPEAA